MAINFLFLGALTAFGWPIVDGPAPFAEAIARPALPCRAPIDSVATDVRVGLCLALEARQDPVPLVRKPHPVLNLPSSEASATEATAVPPGPPPDDDLARRAAKAAAELDGYKRVNIIGKAGNGAWRAKAYRGEIEVLLTVDGSGAVTAD